MNWAFPADTKLQHFFHEQYTKENQARLDWYHKTKRGDVSAQSRPSNRRYANAQTASMGSGLPDINPMEFAMKKKREEEENVQRIIDEARAQFRSEEMLAPSGRQKTKLYDGFTKEGKGRYAYLDERQRTVPEKKYTFPMLTSWRYGWKLDEAAAPVRPHNARTKLIRDTFYTRSGVPTLTQPSTIERSHTIV